MDNIENIFETAFIIIFAPLGLLILYAALKPLFSKKKKTEIIIVYKRKSVYEAYNKHPNVTETYHYTVDCKYPGSDKIHTFGCTEGMFGYFKENRNYRVIVKSGQIVQAEGYSYEFE